MSPSGSEEALRHAAGTALAALASAPGAAGLHVAHAWLGELLIYLSRAVRPYEAVQVQRFWVDIGIRAVIRVSFRVLQFLPVGFCACRP